jgi:glycosyltransferase involved in cell wall biosynthesis
MKLLVFAHTPPPHHGQSYMVQLMLAGFGGDCRQKKTAAPSPHGIECYHVNARFSRGLSDVGKFQGAKILLIFWFCMQAIWLRFRHGVNNFYYVPAPGKRVALYRDWLVMLLCRPFFKTVILHWHAAGLAEWLETSVQMRARALTYWLFGTIDLSIVLSNYNVADVEKFSSRRICIVNNGIPDPCPNFAESVLPRRCARLAVRAKLLASQNVSPSEIESVAGDPQIVKVLFLAHCMKEKGLFDALEGVALANARLRQSNSPISMHLTVAGEFISKSEREQFNQRVAQIESKGEVHVNYLGFVNGEAKSRVFAECDCFCFPTFYHAENFALVVMEAMAFGLPIVTTRWRSIPEILPENYAGLVTIKSPEEVAAALTRFALTTESSSEALREHFLKRFSVKAHLEKLAVAIHCVENL